MNIQDALKLHQSGRFPEAEAAYRQILSVEPRNHHALHFLGVLRAQLGDMPGSVELVSRSLQIQPNDPLAVFHLAEAQRSMSRFAQAADTFARAAQLKPDFAEAHAGGATMLIQLRRWNEALAAATRALSVRRDLLDAEIARGLALHELKRNGEALISFDRAIFLQPGLAQLHFFRGNTLSALNRKEEAVAAFDAALELEPDALHILTNRADVLRTLGRFTQSLADCDHVLARDPKAAPALNNRGLALMELHRLDEALAAFASAIAASGAMDAHYNRASALMGLGRFDEALAELDVVVSREPGNAKACFNRGQVLLSLEDVDGAGAAFKRALGLDPGLGAVVVALAQSAAECCDWSERAVQAEDLRRRALKGESLNNFALLSLFDDPEAHLAAARTRAVKTASDPPPFARHQKLRLAYLSADFHNHPVALQAAELFERHDRARFETFGISLKSWPEVPMRRRLRAAFDHFVDAEKLGDEELVRTLRAQEIDICIDLTGYTDDSRTQMLAMRPAPIAVNYLGYSGTLGASYIDYIVADAVVIPPDCERHYVEKVVHLPGIFMPVDRKGRDAVIPPPRGEEGLPEDGIVFCAFADSCKIAPEIFSLWMRLLKDNENSVLWLNAEKARANLLAEAERQSVAPSRLVFARHVAERSQHLARLGLADMFLDTPVYGGHSTSTDFLWAGVPVVTCLGRSFAARVAASFLTATGVPELVAADLEGYEAVALGLARSAERRAALKQKILASRAQLFDAERLCRNLELAYETMRQHRLSGRHESFSVAP